MSTAPTHEQIAALAFERYASRSYQDGHDVDDWFWAKDALLAQAGEGAGTAAPAHELSHQHEHEHHGHGHHHEHEHHQHGAHDTRHRH